MSQPFYFSEEFGPLFLPNPTTAKHIEDLLTTKNDRIHRHSLDARKQTNKKRKVGASLEHTSSDKAAVVLHRKELHTTKNNTIHQHSLEAGIQTKHTESEREEQSSSFL